MEAPKKPRDLPIDPRDAHLRGQAIEMFARLESSLNSVVSSYYVPRHPLSTYFWMDVLSADGFSYSLRRDIFESIARRHGLYDSKRMQYLHKVGRWRNFLAHVAGVETHEYGADDELLKVGYRDSKHPHSTLTVTEAFEQFKTTWERADDYVSDVLRKIVPMNRSMICGHIVEDPIPPGETYEDWVNSPFKSNS